jgi:integrase
VPCILIQEQELPTPWSPKTEAGERAVPVHAALLDAGFMELVAARQGEERVVPGLVPQGPDGKLGSAFSRDFSRIKTRLGVSNRTVFHSFRHSVSTILRNQDATIREPWIDAVLGHDGDGAKSMGIAVYLKRIGVKNLASTVAAITYPPEVQQAWQELVELRRG